MLPGNSDSRMSKDEYYLGIAKSVSMRSTCLRRCYGSVIVKNDKPVSTGYNGAPRGWENCTSMHKCKREIMNIPRNQRYEECRSVHGEMNAIISASAEELIGSTLYIFCRIPETEQSADEVIVCDMCKRNIINAGIKYVKFYKFGKVETIEVSKWILDNTEEVNKILSMKESKSSLIDQKTEDMIIYNLISERFHELKGKPDTRDETCYQQIQLLYNKYKEKIK